MSKHERDRLQKKRQRQLKQSGSYARRRVLQQLDEVEHLKRAGQWADACALIEKLDDRFPDREEVLAELSEAYFHSGNHRDYQRICERLSRRNPADSEATLRLAGAYLCNARPALAIETFERFLHQAPGDPRAEEVRGEVVRLRGLVGDFLTGCGLGPDAFGVAVQHERIQGFMSAGKFNKVREAAGQLLAQAPDHVPTLNNLSLALFQDGASDEAVARAKRVLELEPDNCHALSNLTRFLLLTGHAAEAKGHAERLKAVTNERVDLWVKKAEALSYLGDDEGVLDAFQAAERSNHRKANLDDPYLFHLAAVASLRLGRESDARRFWRESLRINGTFGLAADNLNNLNRPIGERHAPWSFDFPSWLPKKTMDEFSHALQPAAQTKRDELVEQATRRFLDDHTHVLALIPVLLDRGDPDAREFAMRIAGLAATSQTLVMLHDFVLGQRGPDSLRMQAAEKLTKTGVLSRGSHRFWVKGEWRDVLFLGFEIHGEPVKQHGAEAEPLAREALDALRRGDGVRAEQFIRRALEIEPDSPALLNNLMAAYQLQHRTAESHALVRQIHERFPDYFFGCTNLANLCVFDGEFDRAKDLLQPLLTRERLHFGELAALCGAHINLFLAQKQHDGARSWYEIWKKFYPDSPDLDRWRPCFEPAGLRRLLHSNSRQSI